MATISVTFDLVRQLHEANYAGLSPEMDGAFDRLRAKWEDRQHADLSECELCDLYIESIAEWENINGR